MYFGKVHSACYGEVSKACDVLFRGQTIAVTAPKIGTATSAKNASASVKYSHKKGTFWFQTSKSTRNEEHRSKKEVEEVEGR